MNTRCLSWELQLQVGELAGIAVGSAVCITSILAGPISGGSMNPARSIGPAIASKYYKGIWVSPELYGDNYPKFFTHWTTDAYQAYLSNDAPVS